MKLLIDTQVFIWLLRDDSRLGKKTKDLLSSTKNTLYISFVSLFEMRVKASIGKLTFDSTVLDDLEKMGIELLGGDTAALKNYKIFNEKNKDPFDNFLIATAQSHKWQFVTRDSKILNTAVQGVQYINAQS